MRISLLSFLAYCKMRLCTSVYVYVLVKMYNYTFHQNINIYKDRCSRRDNNSSDVKVCEVVLELYFNFEQPPSPYTSLIIGSLGTACSWCMHKSGT